MRKLQWLFGIVIFLVGCAPRVTIDIDKGRSPLDFREEVKVLDIGETVPEEAHLIGTVKVGDSGFTIDCDYQVVIEKAKMEARKSGGNLVKITDHQLPDLRSSCHRITAQIYYLENIEQVDFKSSTASAYFDTTANYALLHVYRPSSKGALLSYTLHLGDIELCRVKSKSHETVMITKEGPNELWAKTESRTTIPINIEFGKEYYLRCGVSMGIFVGRPTLTLVDNSTGKAEFEKLAEKKR